MQLSYDFYSILPLFALVISFLLVFQSWKYRNNHLGVILIVLLIALFWWSLAAFIERNSLDLANKIFWIKMTYFGIAVLPIAWLTFALQYSQREKWLTKRNLGILGIIPFITLLMVWTNDLHHLMWTSIWLDTSILPPVDAVTHGTWFWVSVAYAYVLILLGTLIMFITFLKSSILYKKQSGTLLIATLAPWVGNILYMTNVGPFSLVDPTPLAFCITCLAFFWGLSHLQLLNIMPVAHEIVLKSMIDGVIILDHQQRIVEINPSAEIIIHRKKKDVLGQFYNEILPPQVCLLGSNSIAPKKQAVIELGECLNKRYYGVYISSVRIGQNLHGSVILLHDETERMKIESEDKHMIILETELIERKKAQEILKESETKFRILAEQSPNMIFINTGSRIAYTNKKCEELLGYTKDEFYAPNFNFLSIIAPECRDLFLSNFGRRKQNDGIPSYEYSLIAKDGKKIDAILSMSSIEYEKGRAFLGTVIDITDLKRMESKLKNEAARQHILIDQSSDGIVVIDNNGKVHEANQQFARMLGYSPEEVLQLNVWDWDYENKSEAGLGLFRDSDKKSCHFETQHRRKDGSIFDVEISSNWARFDEGIRIFCVCRDITDRKKAQEAQRVSEQRYRSLFDNMLNGFAYSQVIYDQENPVDFIYLETNEAFEKLTGLKNVIGKRVTEVYPDIMESDPQMFERYIRLAQGGKPEHLEVYIKSLNVWHSISYFCPAKGFIVSIFEVITERKKAEKQRELSLKILELLNNTDEKNILIRRLLNLFKEDGHFESVGIRLREGNDFPYYETNGFSSEHVRNENRLCVICDKDELLRDDQGNPILECMCGNVISERFDPTKPFFTCRGSFWTNSTTQLLASTTEVDRQARTRNRCNGEGYESVALIPLKANKIIIGLLQINDTRRDCFTPDLIQYYEGLAESIGVALMAKQTQASLLASERKYMDLYKNAPIAYFSTGLDGLIMETNQAAQLLFGYSEQELTGKHRLKLYAPECATQAETILEKLKKGISIENEENVYQRKDGSRIYGLLSATPLKNEKGDIITIRSVIKDISERKQAVAILQERDKRFSDITENASEWIWEIDTEGKCTYSSSVVEKVLGYTPAEILNKHFYDLYLSENREVLKKAAFEVFAQKQPFHEFVSQNVHKSGKTIWLSTSGTPIIDKEGKYLGYRGADTDISERKQAEKILSEKNEELKSFNLQLETKVEERTRQLGEAVVEAQASNQAKSDFLASMSHELRTPLNAIIGFSQVLDAHYFGQLNEKQSEYVKDVLNSGKHLLSLINDILDLSKIEAGKMELELSTVKVADLVRNSLVMIKEKAHSHNIKVEVKVSENIEYLEMEADERKLKQVMFNLLSNASKFTPDGGIIKVEARNEKGELLISVSDTGIGLSAKEKPRLFEAFYQASGGIKDKTPGTGLGLAITKSIIQKHGGRIWVESEGPGKGSCFSFKVPIKVAAGIKA
jgi:PAS domain S-box-containing protein